MQFEMQFGRHRFWHWASTVGSCRGLLQYVYSTVITATLVTLVTDLHIIKLKRNPRAFQKKVSDLGSKN